MNDKAKKTISTVAALVVAVVAVVTIILAFGEYQGNVKSNKEDIDRHEALIQSSQKDLQDVCGRLGGIESGLSGVQTNQTRMLSRLDRIIDQANK